MGSIDAFLDEWRNHSDFEYMESSSPTEVCCQLTNEDGYLGSFCLQRTSEGLVKLAEILVDERKRGRGIGSMMLDAVCTSADAHGITLMTEPSTFSSGPSIFEDDEDLRRWYHRRGFEFKTRHQMSREPRSSK